MTLTKCEVTLISFDLTKFKGPIRLQARSKDTLRAGKPIRDPPTSNLDNLREDRGTCTDTDTLASSNVIYMTRPVIMPLNHNAILGAGSAGSDMKSNTTW